MSGRRPRDAIDRLRRYVQCRLHGTNDKEVCYLSSTYLHTYYTYIHTIPYYCTMPTFPFPFPPPRDSLQHTQHTLNHPTTRKIRPCSLPRVRNQSSCLVNGGAPHEETNLSRGNGELAWPSAGGGQKGSDVLGARRQSVRCARAVMHVRTGSGR